MTYTAKTKGKYMVTGKERVEVNAVNVPVAEFAWTITEPEKGIFRTPTATPSEAMGLTCFMSWMTQPDCSRRLSIRSRAFSSGVMAEKVPKCVVPDF